MILCLAAIFSLGSCVRKDSKDKDEETKEEKPQKPESENEYNFLVMGHDRQASLTDVIMLISFDTEAKTLSLTQIPRDTYFEIDDYGYHKINGLYNYCMGKAREDDAKDPQLEGCKMTAEYLSENLGIKIHYSAVMDLDGFGQIVDAIGGVYMYLPYSMYYSDPGQNLYINLAKGFHTLDGDQAEQFVRFRSGYVNADLARQDAQKMFMTAFIENFKKNIGISNIADVAKAVIENVKTDLKLTDMIKFGTALLSTDLDGITMMSLPGEAVLSQGAWYFAMNKASVAALMEKHYNVYEEKLTAENFDKYEVFCNGDDPEMSEIYLKPAEEFETVEHNAQDVSNNDIDIALK